MKHLFQQRLDTPPSAGAIQFPDVVAEMFVLPNGLTVIVQEDHTAPVASVQAWIETGSIHEGAHLGAGLSHILEHMLFKGTDQRSASEFARGVQNAGGYINAYTSFDRTVYWIDIPSSGVDTALDLLADAVTKSTLPAQEYVKEQEVIRREFAMGFDDPDRVSSLTLFARAYREHPFRHPVIGYLDVFNALERDDVMAYYRARYVPNNMFFVVTGDVDAEAVRNRLTELFADVPRAALPPIHIPEEPLQIDRRISHEEFAATELTRLHMAWHVPDAAHPDLPSLDILAVIVGGGRSSRLYRRLREDLKIVHSSDAWCYAPSHPGLWGVDAMLDPEHRGRVEEEVLRLLQQVSTEGVTAAEVEKARRLSLSHQLQALTTARGRASDLGSNWLIARSLNFSKTYLDALQAVSVEDVQRVARHYLRDQNLTIVSLNPEGSLNRKAAAAAAAKPGEIKKFTLSNGLRLLVREDPRLPLVSVASVFQAGLLSETPATNGITRLLAKTLLKGTENRTAAQIAEEIESVGGTIGSDGGNNSLSVVLRTMRPDLPLALDLLSDVLTRSTLPEEVIEREKEIQIAHIKADEEEMTSIARDLLRAHLFPSHPYGMPPLGTPESVAALTRAQLAEFRDRHLVAGNCVVAVFGDVDAEEVLRAVEAALGGLPAGAPEFPAHVALSAPAQITHVEEHKPKAQAVLMVGYLATDLGHADRAALELIDEASSDLGSRFFVRIREEMGLAYFVGSSYMPGLEPGPFAFYLGTDPLKLTAVQAELMDEIRQLAENGLTSEELERARQKFIGQQEIRNQSSEALAFAVALDELYGLGSDHYLRLRAAVEAVTMEDIKRVAAHYLLQPPVVAVVQPRPGEPLPTEAFAESVES